MSSAIIEAPSSAIVEIFKYCRDAFAEVGINLKFPAHTDPRKTYQWRYLAAFVRKLDGWGIDNHTRKELIFAIVKLAHRQRKLSKGLGILLSDEIVDEACKQVQLARATELSIIDKIRRDYEFVMTHKDQLLDKSNSRGFPNIVKWYKAGYISSAYLSLSKCCMIAINHLDPNDAISLPSKKKLLMTRLMLIKDVSTKLQIKAIMSDDWRDI